MEINDQDVVLFLLGSGYSSWKLSQGSFLVNGAEVFQEMSQVFFRILN